MVSSVPPLDKFVSRGGKGGAYNEVRSTAKVWCAAAAKPVTACQAPGANGVGGLAGGCFGSQFGGGDDGDGGGRGGSGPPGGDGGGGGGDVGGGGEGGGGMGEGGG